MKGRLGRGKTLLSRGKRTGKKKRKDIAPLQGQETYARSQGDKKES